MADKKETKPTITGIRPPEKLVLGSNPLDQWKLFKQRWMTYAVLTSLDQQENKIQVAMFLHVLDDDALRIYNGFDFDTEEENRTLKEVIAKFDEFAIGEVNITAERFKFNNRNQEAGEKFETFLSEIRRLAKNCSFCMQCKDSLLRDRIVIGIADAETKQDLLKIRNLTLDKCIDICRSAEDAKTQGKAMTTTTQLEVAAFAKGMLPKPNYSSKREHNPSNDQRTPYYKSRPRWDRTIITETQRNSQQALCGYCGYTYHDRQNCPARRATCNICHKLGHYQKMCRMRTKTGGVEGIAINPNSDDDETAETFLGHIQDETEQEWTVKIKVNGQPTPFKLDTGAAVSVIGENASVDTKNLQPTKINLKAVGGGKLDVLGYLTGILEYKGKTIEERLYVVNRQTTSLLSRSACVGLGLVARIDEIQENNTPDFKTEFPELFQGLGKLEEPYSIKLKDDVTPVHIFTPRKVAHPLLPQVQKEINKMLEEGVISEMLEPTEWCSGMVVVPKPNGSVRICVDFTGLNKAVKREVHPLNSVDQDLAQFSGSKHFTKLDARSGFWQIPIAEESRKYTTFLTPFGRYCFNRLPFGISSAPEIFQKRMNKILQGTDGVVCHTDDIMVHAADQQAHDTRVRETMRKLRDAGLTLNDKCEFSKPSLKFLGHIIDATGIKADPSKVEAIQKFPQPTNVTELQRFLGMINQFSKFAPQLAANLEPLRKLLRKCEAWIWDHPQEEAFRQVKDQLATTPVLAHYSPEHETVIATDASNKGLGAVLLQIQPDGTRKPVSYISRSLTEAEKNYAVIEKEALATTWASERFSEYVLGLKYTIETDHKPLVPLLTSKELAKLPPRIQRFRLRLARFSPTVVHVSGKSQVVADALSRAPVTEPSEADINFTEEVEAAGQQTFSSLPATSQRINLIITHQKSDPELVEIRKFCSNGWPTYMPANTLLTQYWTNQQHFSIVNDLLLYNERIVVPRDLRLDILNKLHESHLGINKCKSLAQTSVWWPNITSQIEDMVRRCHVCAKLRPDVREPLLPSSLPERPWSRLGMDLFDLKGKPYLIATDYFSRWPEIRILEQLSSTHVIIKLKSIFATHGIPDVVVSDNGPQFACAEFTKFAKEWGFVHTTSSPRYPQSNGAAERAVQTVKNMLKKAKDPYAALLNYRATPLHNGFSPSELLMGRKIQTKMPIPQDKLIPCTPNHQEVRNKEMKYKENQRRNFNNRHRAKELPELEPGDMIYMKDLQREGMVVGKHHNPRSYMIKTEQNSTPLRRNRKHLVLMTPHENETPTQHDITPTRGQPPAAERDRTPKPGDILTPNQPDYQTSRYGRCIRPPDRLDL